MLLTEKNTNTKTIITKNGDQILVCNKFYDLFKFIKISIGNNGYARVRGVVNYKEHSYLLHHLVIGKPQKGMVVDHINQNKLDNRRCNLRFATKSKNSINTNKRKKNKTGFIGVYYDTRNKMFDAYITVKQKRIYKSGFKTAIEAAKERDKMFKEHFGQTSFLNFPEKS